jgi:hypothetical protein
VCIFCSRNVFVSILVFQIDMRPSLLALGLCWQLLSYALCYK